MWLAIIAISTFDLITIDGEYYFTALRMNQQLKILIVYTTYMVMEKKYPTASGY